MIHSARKSQTVTMLGSVFVLGMNKVQNAIVVRDIPKAIFLGPTLGELSSKRASGVVELRSILA